MDQRRAREQYERELAAQRAEFERWRGRQAVQMEELWKPMQPQLLKRTVAFLESSPEALRALRVLIRGR